jgi:hypothetical protein
MRNSTRPTKTTERSNSGPKRRATSTPQVAATETTNGRRLAQGRLLFLLVTAALPLSIRRPAQ